jgi:tetratricopeptide (TPR) repeat protein
LPLLRWLRLMLKIRPYRLLIFAFAGFFLYSCTQYKNAFINRHFHNVTGRFNAYFYAKESLKDGLFKIETTNKDDYNKLLPVFIYPTKETAKNVTQEMDRTIKKASACIQKHAIKDKQTKVEIPNTGRWIDDCWNAIGKAHFYKREFFSGIEAFEYVQAVYKSKQKYEAWLWEMKTYNELNSLTQSLTYINLIKNDKKFPVEYKGHFEALYAEFYIKQGAWEEAIKHLLLAVKFTKNHNYVARYHFILGQLYEMKDDHAKAKIHYHLCIKNKPIYDMVFYAKMKESLLNKDPESIAKAKKELLVMVKDIKNEDFKDVIYYTLGQMEEKGNDLDKAFGYYKLSAKNSTSNPPQKAKSYLKLADISFDRENYQSAAGYYDSTVAIIKDDFPNYQDIISKKKSLNTLVLYVTTIHNEDSLQRVAKMDSSTRNKFITGIIKKLIADEKKAAEAKQNNSLGTPIGPNQPFVPTAASTGAAGQWYFYNVALKSQGLNDYVKRWGGTRKNEDNWRRSTKTTSLDQISDNTNPDKKDSVKAGKKDSVVVKTNDPHQIPYYLKGLPFSQADIDSSNKRVLEAYYALGSLYREQLNNSKKSAETFEVMNKRFPRNPYEAPSYYQMYRIYYVAKNESKANQAKEFLLSNYPNSDYAKIINDPDFSKSASAEKNKIEAYYGETYDLYLQKNYAEAMERSRVAIVKFGKNDYTARFAYLNALSKGYLYGIDSLEQGLRIVTIRYNKSEVYDQAKLMLDAVKKQKKGFVAPDSTKKEEDLSGASYLYNADAQHYVMFILNGSKDLETVKSILSDFNGQYFSLSNFTIMPSVHKNDKEIICIKTFANKDEAMGYHDLLISKANLFKDKGIEKKDYDIWAISTDNIGTLLKKDSFEDYRIFFNAKYLGIKQ